MTFRVLQSRLIAVIRLRVRSGETTERAFARTVGVSQPHLHNVLKGVRAFSPETSDRILEELGLTVLDLLSEPQAGLSPRASPRPLPDMFREPGGRYAAS